MALQDGFPSASGLASANDIRLGLAGLVLRDTSGNPRTGVFPRHANALVTSTATMNSSVAAAEFLVSRSGQGPVFLPNDGPTNVLHSAAPVSNSRYDIIYVKQFDSVSPNADATNVPAFGVFAGPASAGPTPYTYATAKAALAAAVGIGAGAEPLAMALIPSTATTMQSGGVVYTQLNQYTCATGGAFLVRAYSDLAAETGYLPGQLAVALDTKLTYRWNGTGWPPIDGPACALRKTAAQNLSTSAAAVIWDVETSDPAGMHDNVTNNTRILLPVPGLYEVTASVFNSNTSGLGTLYGRLNGTTDIASSLDRRTGDGNSFPLRTVFPVTGTASTDYVEIMILHATSAGNISGGTSNGAAGVTVKWIGPA